MMNPPAITIGMLVAYICLFLFFYGQLLSYIYYHKEKQSFALYEKQMPAIH